MKAGGFIGALLASTVLTAPALAQRQPAQMTTIPTFANPPQEFDLLDNTGAWQRLGYVGANSGAVFSVDQYGVVKGDFVNDDGPAIQTAINAAAVNGGTVLLNGHPYWNKTQALVVPANVHLTCSNGFNKRRTIPPGYSAMPCTIYQNAGTSASPGPASFKSLGAVTDIGLLHDAVHSYPATTTRAQIEALISAFYGTGIAVGNLDGGFTGTASIIQNVLIGGFAQCIAQNGAAQVQIRQTLGDCTNGYDLNGSFDNNFLSHMEMWEFLTTSIPTGTTSWNITGMADNGSGLWRLTIASSADPPVTGEQLWVFPGQGSIVTGTPTSSTAPGGSGAQGLWTVTAVDATHVDLQGSQAALTTPVATTGTTNNLRTYVAVASTVNLAPGMNVSGAGVPAGAVIAAVWRSRSAISLDQAHPATASASGVALSFTNNPYSGSGGTLHFEKNVRFGTGFAIGYADGTTCEGCFEYGFLNGFNFRGGSYISFVNSNIDGPGTLPPNQNWSPVGVQFNGGTSGAYFQTNALNTGGVGVLNNATPTGPGGRNVVVVSSGGGSSFNNRTLLENAAGGLSVENWAGTYGGAWLLDDAVSVIPSILNVNMPVTRIYSTAAVPRFFGAGNNFGGNPEAQGALAHKAQGFWAAGNGSANYNLYDASQPANGKYWRLQSGGGALCVQPMDDPYTTSGGSSWCAHRSGDVPIDVTMGAPMILPVFNIANLPVCGPSLKGASVIINNGQASPPYLGVVGAAGATVVSGLCDGTNWVYH